ncbi:MAG: hypothetical protein ACOCZE_10545 [Planctomycetota bacterium]
MVQSAGRNVLKTVPHVGFYPDMSAHEDSRMRCPEDVPLPSVMRSCLEYLGDGVGWFRKRGWLEDT